MTDYFVKGTSGIIRKPPGGGGGTGLILVGVHASTLIGFGTQDIAAGSGYVGIFHDNTPYFNGCIFDGVNVTPSAENDGHWHYAANGKIVGTPSSGQCRVVIAGQTEGATYAGELAREVFDAADFNAYGYVGYNVFAKAPLVSASGDNLGLYLVNDTDVTLHIEQGDPDDGTGPPACQMEAYLLTFLGAGGS